MSRLEPLPATDDQDAWAQEVLRRQCALLGQLGDAGLRMAQAIERQVSEAGASTPPTEAAMAFARVARAVRLTALLQSRLVQDAMRLSATAAQADADAGAAKARSDPAYRHKARVEAIVERVARAGADDEQEVDRLVAEAGERLDDEDVYGQVLDRPVGELVSLVCRDLGLDPDWTRLGEEAWAQAEAASGDPRSPFFPTAPTRSVAGGGPSAERSEEPMVEGTSLKQYVAPSLVFDSC
jgi:uncharacterized protein YpuA (DUF1002 family)